MAKLAYTEVFYSMQGEGRYVGVPSVFLRTFGCNFRCRGFGRMTPLNPAEKVNPEVEAIMWLVKENPEKYPTFKDLPLVNTGCDTYASIYPEFKKFAQHGTPDEVAAAIVATLPDKYFKGQHLVITGGEPLLGWQKFYPEIIDNLYHNFGLSEVTFETNGTQKIGKDLLDFVLSGRNIEWTFSVSPKLTVSGESHEDAIKPDVILQYVQAINAASRISHGESQVYLKFVVDNEFGIVEVQEAVSEYEATGVVCPVYLMPVGGTGLKYYENNATVAGLALKYGYRYSPRLQVDLWKNAWGT